MLKDIVFDMDVSENRGTPESSILLFLCVCFFVHFVVGIVCKCRFMVLPCRPKELHFRPCDAQDTAQVFKTRPRVGGFEIRAGDTDYCLDTWICLVGVFSLSRILGDSWCILRDP